MSNTGQFEISYGETAMTFNYTIDPPQPLEDYSYIFHRNGKVELRPGLDNGNFNKEALRQLVFDNIPIDEFNPPLVVYVKVGKGESNVPAGKHTP